MGIIVQKFGGSSVADKDKLLNVCRHIIKEYKKNEFVYHQDEEIESIGLILFFWGF